MSSTNLLRKLGVRTLARDLAYSKPARSVARVLVESEDSLARRAVEKRGKLGALQRLASESLPSGYFFAKLTIHDWQSYDGLAFLLCVDGEPVYGNTVESPQRGFPLVYRNFVVPTSDVRRFDLDLPAGFKLQFSRAPFTTEQQEAYDSKYGVRQAEGFSYSLRGNLKNPKKLIVTFPGFGPSTSRVSYAVTYLQQISEVELVDAAVLCFQDRFGVAGTYMVSDSGGRPLQEKLSLFLSKMMNRLGIRDEDMLFFGASKGGSIALMAAEQFPSSTLVVAVPQLDLPYYLSKPFFANNLGLSSEIRRRRQPRSLLQQYIKEGRRIHYFYTNDDELSNYSCIEFPVQASTLFKYRFSGVHGEVARKALPAMLGLIRRFLSPTRNERSLGDLESKEYLRPAGLSLQVRTGVASTDVIQGEAIRFIRFSDGKSVVFQACSNSTLPMVGYLDKEQQLSRGIDSPDSSFKVVEISNSGVVSETSSSHSFSEGARDFLGVPETQSELSLLVREPRLYSVSERSHVAVFEYLVLECSERPQGVSIEYGSHPVSGREQRVSKESNHHRILVSSNAPSHLIVTLARRFAVLAGVRTILLSVEAGFLTAQLKTAVHDSDWAELTLRPLESREVL